jgi:hypothetical protein
MIDKVKQSFVKVYNLVQREFAYSAQVDTSGKYIPYFDHHDGFPVELAQLVAGSPTATSCLSTLTDFIAGEGFNQGEELENLVLNKQGLKFSRFHDICSGSMAHEWGVAAIVKFNKVGDVTEVYDIPFGYCRLGMPDGKGVISKIKYNPYFGTQYYKLQDTEEYDSWNPGQAAVQAAKPGWKGQIYWLGIRDRKHQFYPIPDYYSAKSWMSVEKNAGVYFEENLQNGFLQDTIMKLIGDPNDPSGLKDSDDNDIPKQQAFDEEMTNNFGQGAKSRHRIIAFWGNNKEEWPELQAFPTSGNPDLFRIQDEHAIKKITIATKVPAILANISEGVSLGGDGNTIRAAVKLMQQRVVRPQNLLIGFYQDLLSKMVTPYTEPIKITAYNPFPELETIDQQAWEVLSQEEKRKWVKDHTEIELIETPVQNTVPQTQPVQAQGPPRGTVVNLHFNNYPSKVKTTIKRALDWQEKMQTRCSSKAGLEISNSIMEGRPLGPKEIRRLSNFLSKKVLFKDHPYSESCESVLFDAWGGSEMMTWANDMVKQLRGDE